MRERERLYKKIILITGSQGLLGKNYVDFLIKSGAIVIACDINNFPCNLDEKNRINFSIKKNLIYYYCDIQKEKSVEKMFEELKGIEVYPNSLVNNAARNPSLEKIKNKVSTRFEDFSLEEFKLDLDISLVGSFLCSKYFYKNALKEKIDNLNIVNISSDLGIISPDQRLYAKNENKLSLYDSVKPVSYSICKHGIHGLTKYLATYDPKRLRSNTLYPGGVFNEQNEEFLKRIIKRIPQGRMANQSEFNGALNFLLSEDSKYMNGSSLIIDGGRSSW